MKETIVPRVYVSLPESTPVDIDLTEADSPAENPFLSDLIFFYAFDKGTHFEMVSKGDLDTLELDKEQLHDLAVENLRNLDLEVKAHRGERILMLTAGGNYEAALILLPEIWDSIAKMVQGNIVISIPARDILYVTGDGDPENLKDLRKYTSQALEQADKPLSRSFFQRVDGSWTVYEGFAD